MYRALSATARRCSRVASMPMVNRRGFALVYFLSGCVISRNDISVRKRMTIGMTGFAVVAVGAFYGGRSIYRSRKAKKNARIAAAMKAKEEESMPKPATPVIAEHVPVPTPEPEPEPAAEVPCVPVAEEKVEEAPVEEKPAEEKPVEEAPAEEAPLEEKPAEEKVEEKEAPVEEKETTEEKPAEQPIAEAKEEEYHPWWIGVKEIDLFLNKEDTERMDALFPATHNYKFA